MKIPPALAKMLAAQHPAELRDRVTLPAPPSANALFLVRDGRRVKSKAYRDWLDHAVPLLAFLKPPGAYPCRYRLHLAGKWNAQRDGENTLKPTLDAIVAAGVIRDDCLKWVHGGEWTYEAGGVGPPTVTVWLECVA